MSNRKIPATVRNTVWYKYINKGDPKCFCCKTEPITKGNFECGHIISHTEGGDMSIENLRPICSLCNKSIGKINMIEFMKTYGYDKANIKEHTQQEPNDTLHNILLAKRNKYNNDIIFKTVADILLLAKEKEIKLNPPYQRGDVWDEERRGWNQLQIC